MVYSVNFVIWWLYEK